MTKAIWVTGLPASGKTTLARTLVASLRAHGQDAELVDSDEVRAAITPSPTYDQAERLFVYRAMAYLSERLRRRGVVPVVAATAHDPRLRAAVTAILDESILVFAQCPVETCEARDPKGLYRRARARDAGTMPGVHVAYEPPTDPDVVVDTTRPVEPAAVDSIVARALA